MSKAANKTMIGAFVLGAVVLAVVAVLVFGSGKFLKTTNAYDMYFEGSVLGLEVGSPVIFRGVKIGTVTDIELEFQPGQLAFYIPVTVGIEPDKWRHLGPAPEKKGELLKPLIDKGLRAQLQTTSLVTGQLAVSLDFFPDKPANFVAIHKKNPEIPTVPTQLSQITKTIQELPIQALFAKLDSSLESINKLVSSDAAQTSMESLNDAIVQAKALIKNLDSRIAPLVASLQKTSDGISSAVGNLDTALHGNEGLMASLQSTSNNINSAVSNLNTALQGDKGVPVQLQQTLEATRKTLAQAEQTMSSVQSVMEQNSTMGYEIGSAVAEMSKSMRSLRALSDYIERHPEAILRGKKAS